MGPVPAPQEEPVWLLGALPECGTRGQGVGHPHATPGSRRTRRHGMGAAALGPCPGDLGWEEAHTHKLGKLRGRLSSRKSGIKATVERKAGQFCFSKGPASHLVTGKKPLGMLRGEGCRARGWRSRAGRARWLWLGAAPTASSFFSPLGHSCSQQVLGRLSQKLCTGQQGETQHGGGVSPAAAPRPPLQTFYFRCRSQEGSAGRKQS